jgi:AcrR family transcriptional regulator
MTEFTERQQQIIDVSIQIIANRGIQKLTIKNISKEIGISEAAIYRHFDSKFHILMAILDSFENIAESVLQNIDPEKSCLEQIETFVMDRYQRFSENPALSKVMFSEEVFQDDERLSQKIISIMHKHKEKIVTCVDIGQKKGEIRDDIPQKDMFRVIIGSMRLTTTQWHLSEHRFDLVEEGRLLWNSVKKMMTE